MGEMPYRVALGRAAETLRRAQGFRSVVDLAAQTGFPASTAYKIEGGKELERTLMLSTLHAYADAVGISMGHLFALADEIYARTAGDNG